MIDKKTKEEILQFKRQMELCHLDVSHFLYAPQVPMVGLERSFVVEEIYGVKVARLISAPDD